VFSIAFALPPLCGSSGPDPGFKNSHHPITRQRNLPVLFSSSFFMKRVTILAMFNTMASTVIGPVDIFYQNGVIWYKTEGMLSPD